MVSSYSMDAAFLIEYCWCLKVKFTPPKSSQEHNSGIIPQQHLLVPQKSKSWNLKVVQWLAAILMWILSVQLCSRNQTPLFLIGRWCTATWCKISANPYLSTTNYGVTVLVEYYLDSCFLCCNKINTWGMIRISMFYWSKYEASVAWKCIYTQLVWQEAI